MLSVGRRSEANDMTEGFLRTWPDRSYDRVVTSREGSPLPRAAVPLSSLLSHMSLAYSPITKGLHLVKSSVTPDDSSPTDPDDNYEKDKLALNSPDNEKDYWTIEEANDKIEPENRECKVDEAFVKTGASSFSSIVSSLSSDATPFPVDDVDSSLRLDEDDRSQISFECGEQSKFFVGDESPKPAKRKSITGFFSKNLFSWKNNGNSNSWRFLGKSLLPNPDERSPSSNHSASSSFRGSSQSIDSNGGQRYCDVVASSSALILHERPASLPAKSEDERVKHHQEYKDIVDAAKRKEEKVSKQRKKILQRQLKWEEELSNAVKIWNEEILPHWVERRNQRRTRDLWWAGLPPCVRGRVWRLAVENDLNITPQLYQICASRAQERLSSGTDNSDGIGDGCDNESSMELIQLDIARTFPQLCIFQKGGPYYDMLHSVLGAYVCYRPDVGYVQGMSFLAAILILNMDPPDAFICFANLLNRPCLHAFFTLNQPLVESYFSTYNDLLKENLPRLTSHMAQAGLTPDLYLLDWIYSVFGKAVSLDITCRIWDVFLRDSEEFLFRTALGILHLYEKDLLELDFVHGAQFLTRLPDALSADDLFRSISSIKMIVGKLSFAQILYSHSPR